jgi:hypothetical protein
MQIHNLHPYPHCKRSAKIPHQMLLSSPGQHPGQEERGSDPGNLPDPIKGESRDKGWNGCRQFAHSQTVIRLRIQSLVLVQQSHRAEPRSG